MLAYEMRECDEDTIRRQRTGWKNDLRRMIHAVNASAVANSQPKKPGIWKPGDPLP